jgi:translation initiation factor 2 alpha subunit (eIF-2alpha)
MDCRFYRETIPNTEDIIIVKILNETDLGFDIELLEYNNLKGFLPITEIIKGRTRKRHLVKIGDIYTVSVNSTVDNLIEVSKKRILKEEDESMRLKYRYCYNLNRIGKEIYYLHCNYYKNKEQSIELLMEKTVWRLYDKYKDINYMDLFNKVLLEPNILVEDEWFDDNLRKYIIESITKRTNIINSIQLKQFILVVISEDGIDGIKDILNVTLDKEYEDRYSLTINMKSPPKYELRLDGSNEEEGKKILDNVLDKIKSNANKYNTQFNEIDDIILERPFRIELKYLTKKRIKKLMN